MRTDLRHRYLEAMGIDVWLVRQPQAGAGTVKRRIRLGPGKGARLFICAGPEACSQRLAADVARACPEPPVWAWPDESAEAMNPRAAVSDGLFSSILVFGEDLADQLFGPDRPDSVASARLAVAPSVAELAESAALRRGFWRQLVVERAAGKP